MSIVQTSCASQWDSGASEIAGTKWATPPRNLNCLSSGSLETAILARGFVPSPNSSAFAHAQERARATRGACTTTQTGFHCCTGFSLSYWLPSHQSQELSFHLCLCQDLLALDSSSLILSLQLAPSFAKAPHSLPRLLHARSNKSITCNFSHSTRFQSLARPCTSFACSLSLQSLVGNLTPSLAIKPTCAQLHLIQIKQPYNMTDKQKRAQPPKPCSMASTMA